MFVELALRLEQLSYQVLEIAPSVEVCYLVEDGVLDVNLNPALRKFTADGTAVCKKFSYIFTVIQPGAWLKTS